MKQLHSLKKFIGEQRLLPKLACICCVAVLSACATDSSWYQEEPEPTIETTGVKKLEQIVPILLPWPVWQQKPSASENACR